MSKSTLANLDKIEVKMDDGMFDLLVTDAPEGARKVVALSTAAPVQMVILTQDGLDMGFGDDEAVDIVVPDFSIFEDEEEAGNAEQMFVLVCFPPHIRRGGYLGPEALEELTYSLDEEKDMRDYMNRCLLNALWGADPIEGFPGWDEVYKHLGEQGAHRLIDRLKALEIELEQEA